MKMRAILAARESHRDGLSASTALTCLGGAGPDSSPACDIGIPALVQSSQGFCAEYKTYQLGFVGFYFSSCSDQRGIILGPCWYGGHVSVLLMEGHVCSDGVEVDLIPSQNENTGYSYGFNCL